jgi:preprotein translocase subunit SecD
MKIRLARFNIYYSMLLLLGLALGGWGCQTDNGQQKAPKKGFSLLRLHLEVNADGTDKNGTVMVGRHAPFPVNVNKLAFVEPTHLARASLVEDEGGFKLRILLNRQGAWLLEQYTVANKGRRIAVFAELDDFCWIAAPVISKRISDGVFTFTPDATREEAENLVLGLTKMIKKERSRNNLNEPEVK